jgi:phenylacetic acid degradation operon negative regulatory protein
MRDMGYGSVMTETGMGGLPPKVPILSIYGLYARQMGNWLAISDLVQLMGSLGYAEQVTRSAASRM